jgi:hypothetical protein
VLSRAVYKKRRGRRLLVGLAALALVTSSFAIAGTVLAVHDTGVFQLEGDAQTATGATGQSDDWDKVCKALPSNCTFQDSLGTGVGALSTKNTAKAFQNDGASNATTFTGGGSKDGHDMGDWKWNNLSGGLPAKDNLQDAFAARYALNVATTDGGTDPGPAPSCPVTGSQTTCQVLYYGMDRLDNSGDAQNGFWFFQNQVCLKPDGSFGSGDTTSSSDITCAAGASAPAAAHVQGDILIVSDFSIGGTISTITVYQWDTACPATANCVSANIEQLNTIANAKCGLAANDAFCGIVNPTNGTIAPWNFTDKSGNNTYLQGEMYEGGINLSALSASIASECFSSFAAESRSSTSITATLKDFVLGNFGQCKATLATQVSSASVNPGTAVHDTATVTGNQPTKTPSGAVTFFLCSFDAGTTDVCDGTAGHVGTQLTNVPPQGNLAATATPGQASADSPDVNAGTAAAPSLSPGRYCFRATWPGDGNYKGALTEFGGATECFVVLQSSTTTVTEPRLASNGTAITGPVAVNTHVVDHALITGATGFGTPTGTVSFFICTPSQVTLTGGAGTEVCASGDGTAVGGNPVTATAVAGSSIQSEATSGGTPHDAANDVVANVVGVWCFRATYTSNTANYTGSSDNTHDECFTVRDSASATTHQIWLPNDNATITSAGGTALNGTVTFELYSGSTCSGTKLYPQAGDPAGTGVFTLTNATSPASAGPTTNSAVKVEADATVSWKVTFASTNGNVTSPANPTCEISTLDLTPNQ